MTGIPYLYLCGVAGRWADNLHLAMESAKDEEVQYEDDRIRVRVRDAPPSHDPGVAGKRSVSSDRSVLQVPQLSVWLGVFSRRSLRLAPIFFARIATCRFQGEQAACGIIDLRYN